MVRFNADVPQYLPVILERYTKFKAGKFAFQNLKFSEYLDDADHDSGAFDLYFICSDGIVPAHRLVIANVSKYIMSMLDDQPPWYPIKIHIPDLASDILQILVDLAYSGEMRFHPDQQNDIIDAMQSLGWIHTDCLSAEFIDGELTDSSIDLNELKDEKAGRQREEETLEETGLNFVFPTSSATSGSQASPKSKAFFGKEPEAKKSGVPASGRMSFTEEDDDSMEISRLPDFDVSDSEDAHVSGTKKQKLAVDGNSGTDTGTSFGNLSKTFKSDGVGKITPLRTPERRSSRASASGNTLKSNQSQTEEKTSQDTKQVKGGSKSSTPSKPAPAKKTPLKRGTPDKSAPVKLTRKLAEIDESEVAEVPLSPVVEESSVGSLSDSPGKRQRRKPKRFEEFEEIPAESSRSKPSPTKNSSRGKKSSTSTSSIKSLDNDKEEDLGSVVKVSSGKTKPQTTPMKKNEKSDLKTEYSIESSNGKEAVEASNSSKPILKSSSRSRKPRVSAEKNSLITSFFKKEDDKSDDVEEEGNEQEELAVLDISSSDDAVIVGEQTSKPLPKSSTAVKKSVKAVPAKTKTKLTGEVQEAETPVKKRGNRRESNVSTSTNGSSRASVSTRPKSKQSNIDEDHETEKSDPMNISTDDDFVEVKVKVNRQDKKSSRKLGKPDPETSLAIEKDTAKSDSSRASRKSTRGTKRQHEGADDSKTEGRMRSRKSTKDESESPSAENTEIGSSNSRRSSKTT